MVASKNNQIVLQGNRNIHNGMWVVPLDQKASHTHRHSASNLANGIIKTETTVNDLIHF